jgi:hypothetical protein
VRRTLSEDSEQFFVSLLELADLAGVPDASRPKFFARMALAIEEARISDWIKRNKPQPVTAANVEPLLRRVLTAITALDLEFSKLQGEGVETGDLAASVYAGTLFENALGADNPAVSTDVDVGFLSQIAADRRWLSERRGAITSAIEQVRTTAPSRRRGRPRGTGGNPAFDTFMGRMDEIAAATQSRWTLTRVTYSDEPEWEGTLLQALIILRPYLPPIGFFPDPNMSLGSAIERARRASRHG